jgi:Tfp pilus assembly protein PilW
MRIPTKPNRRSGPGGTTLVELMVAVGVGSIVMAVVMALSLYSSRSFVAMGNYVDLDQSSRQAVDQMLKEIRQASALISFQTNIPKTLIFTNTAGYTVTYQWISNATSSKIVQTRNGITADLLTGCELWNFKLCKRVPIPNTTNEFYPATDLSGAINPAMCKLIDMSWKCSRTMLGKKFNTENVQTAQVVLRNQKTP